MPANVQLLKYGYVHTCKEIKGQVVTILITKQGFNKLVNVLEFIEDCCKLFPNYPIMETCIVEDNFGFIVLTSPQN